LTGLVFQIVSRQRFYRLSDLAALVLGTLLIPVLWFGLQVVENGWWFVREFLDYQVGLFSQPIASHGQQFYYHALVLLFLCFPLTVLVLPGLLQKSDSGFERWMKSLFWVVLILFSVVTTKIVHYSSLCYFPMALIAGTYLELASIRKWQKVLILIIALSLFAVISTLALMMGPLQFADSWLSHIRDPFVLSQLKNSADWPLSIAFLAAGIPILAFYLVLKPAVTRLATYLVLHTALTAFLFLEMTPAIESSTQNAWIEQLKTYQSRSMVHYTIGFKSYAHLFYTEIKPDDRVDSLRKTVLQEMSKKEFYDLNSEEKRAFDSRLKYKVLHESKIPLSITIKEGNLLNDEDSRVLKEVFRGNGYIVYERKSA
jgi:hypothetical protein